MKRFSEIYSGPKPVLSLEFFPPRSAEKLTETKDLIKKLASCRPDFMTVTYGANGGTRAFSADLVHYISDELRVPAVHHLTCIAHTTAEIDDVVAGLETRGIKHILALRGDIPKEGIPPETRELRCARDLVQHLARGNRFSIGVAGYPETHRDASSPEADITYLQEKVDAGAEVIFTQLFFEPELYLRFVERARNKGITCPIVPGIMPISSLSQLEKFVSLCGASIPEVVKKRLSTLTDDPEGVIEYGIDFATAQSEALLRNDAPGLHFYTINRARQVEEIVRRLGGLTR